MVNAVKIVEDALRASKQCLDGPVAGMESQFAPDLEKMLFERASSPVGDDPLHVFSGEMSEEEINAQFEKLIQKAKKSVAP